MITVGFLIVWVWRKNDAEGMCGCGTTGACKERLGVACNRIRVIQRHERADDSRIQHLRVSRSGQESRKTDMSDFGLIQCRLVGE